MSEPIEIGKVQKIALLITYHTQVAPIGEPSLMLLISWVVNGVDAQLKNGEPRIDWRPYLEFAEAVAAGQPDEAEAEAQT